MQLLDRDRIKRREPKSLNIFASERASFFHWVMRIEVSPQVIDIF
jgi:hypothetical protein